MYVHRPSHTVADLVVSEDKTAIITRINVPHVFRGRGHGSRILQSILVQADDEEVKLILAPSASGGLGQEELEAWYLRHGFEWTGLPGKSTMLREPHSTVPDRPNGAEYVWTRLSGSP